MTGTAETRTTVRVRLAFLIVLRIDAPVTAVHHGRAETIETGEPRRTGNACFALFRPLQDAIAAERHRRRIGRRRTAHRKTRACTGTQETRGAEHTDLTCFVGFQNAVAAVLKILPPAESIAPVVVDKVPVVAILFRRLGDAITAHRLSMRPLETTEMITAISVLTIAVVTFFFRFQKSVSAEQQPGGRHPGRRRARRGPDIKALAG